MSLGAGPTTVFRRIVLPLLVPGVAGGWMLAFIQSFDEVTMTVFVATPGTTTLPVAMYSYISQSIDPLVASVSTVLTVVTVAGHAADGSAAPAPTRPSRLAAAAWVRVKAACAA